MATETKDAECNWAGCAVSWDDVGCPECGKHGYGFDSQALMAENERLRIWVSEALGELEAVQRHDGEAPSTATLIERAHTLLPATKEA